MSYLKKATLLIAFLPAILSLCLITAAAEETTGTSSLTDNAKTYSITEQNGSGVILEKPTGLMFWEYPTLSAGQSRDGTITIINDDENTVALSLSSIELPYGDEQALTYLSALRITVTYNGTSLYDGAYSGIAGENGLQFQLPSLAHGESATLQLTLHCAFWYTGTPSEVTNNITWGFKANAKVDAEPDSSQNEITMPIKVVLAAAVILLVLSQIFRIKRKQK